MLMFVVTAGRFALRVIFDVKTILSPFAAAAMAAARLDELSTKMSRADAGSASADAAAPSRTASARRDPLRPARRPAAVPAFGPATRPERETIHPMICPPGLSSPFWSRGLLSLHESPFGPRISQSGGAATPGAESNTFPAPTTVLRFARSRHLANPRNPREPEPTEASQATVRYVRFTSTPGRPRRGRSPSPTDRALQRASRRREPQELLSWKRAVGRGRVSPDPAATPISSAYFQLCPHAASWPANYPRLLETCLRQPYVPPAGLASFSGPDRCPATVALSQRRALTEPA